MNLNRWKIEELKFANFHMNEKISKNYENFKIPIQIRHDPLPVFKPGTLWC